MADLWEVMRTIHPPGPGVQYVSTTGNDANAGTSVSRKRTIQAAITALGSAGGVVYVADGAWGTISLSNLNYSNSSWLIIKAENRYGATINSYTITDSSYVGIWGFSTAGSGAAVGFNTYKGHHYAVWCCRAGQHSTQGFGCPGNFGYANNMSYCYNVAEECAELFFGSGFSFYQLSNYVGQTDHNWVAGYDNIIVGNISMNNYSEPWADGGQADANGIIIDDMWNLQTEYSVQDNVKYLGNWLLLGNLCVANGGAGLHNLSSDLVDYYFNTVANNGRHDGGPRADAGWEGSGRGMDAVCGQYGGRLTSLMNVGGNLVRENATGSGWFERSTATNVQFPIANVVLYGNDDTGARLRRTDGWNYFATNPPTLTPRLDTATQWIPDGGAGSIEKVSPSSQVRARLSIFPDLLGNWRPDGDWTIGALEASPGGGGGGSAPVASFTKSASSVQTEVSVSFTDTSTNTPTSWAWDFGDGTTSTSQNPSKSWNSPATYTVTLTATNASGSSTTQQTVTVTSQPGGGGVSTVLQAETLTIVGSDYPGNPDAMHVKATSPGSTGAGAIGYWYTNGEALQWTYVAPTSGTYTISVRYQSVPGAERVFKVNGVTVATINMPANAGEWDDGTWTQSNAVSFSLTAGSHTMQLLHDGITFEWPVDVDSITITAPADGGGGGSGTPVASFTASHLAVDPNDVVTFTDTSMGNPAVSVPAFPAGTPVNITTLGVSAAGGDQQTAIQTALNNAASGAILFFPAGTYNHSGVITVTKPVTLYSTAGAKLVGTDPLNMSLKITGSNVRIEGLTFEGVGDTRQSSDHECAGIAVVEGASNVVIKGCVVRQSSAAGIFIEDATNYYIVGNRVIDSLSDAIHQTGTSSNGYVLSNIVTGTGDDRIAVVSYDGQDCNNILISGNTVSGGFARGISVVGGRSVTIQGNTVTGSAAAGIYLASEPSYNTEDVSTVMVRDNTLIGCNTDAAINHGAVFLWGGRTGKPVADVTIYNNTISDTVIGAAHFVIQGSNVTNTNFLNNATTGTKQHRYIEASSWTMNGNTHNGVAVANQGSPIATPAAINLPTGWSWNFGDGTTSTTRNPTKSWSTGGAKTVTLVASNAAGNSTPATLTITVSGTPPPGDAPVANFTFSPASPTVGQTVTFTDTSTNTPTSWAWDFGD